MASGKLISEGTCTDIMCYTPCLNIGKRTLFVCYGMRWRVGWFEATPNR